MPDRLTLRAASLAFLVWLSVGAFARAAPTPPADTQSVAWAVQQADQCAAAVQQAEQRYKLPPGLIGSIAKAESGRPVTAIADIRAWPWTIDADGTGLFFDSKAAAIAWMRQIGPRHNYVDVGCMQVDLQFHPKAFPSLEQAFDPAANVDYAARLLVDLYNGEAGGSWDLAVGLYHSHTPLLAAQYRARVAEVGAGVLHGVLTGTPLYVRAIRQGTLRIALGQGRTVFINVHRQPAGRARRSLSNCQIVRVLGPYLNGGRGTACTPPTRQAQRASTPD